MDSRPEISSYKTKTTLSLPFHGEWLVLNGGRDSEKNGHRAEDGSGPVSQMYAYDFIKTHVGDGKHLEDYEAFGADVLAPGDGRVVQVIDGNEDLAIDTTDTEVATGNAIVIDHENGEWSVIAHLKYASIKVKPGDRVARGDLIGSCGNTGNTSEPHIHYHLQNGPDLYNETGLPAWFGNIYIDGELHTLAEPEGDQRVSNNSNS